jgi:hypothetical protein
MLDFIKWPFDKTTPHVNADLSCNSFFPRPKNRPKCYPEKAENIGEIEVDTTTIDNFCNRESITRIDILKLEQKSKIQALLELHQKYHY